LEIGRYIGAADFLLGRPAPQPLFQFLSKGKDNPTGVAGQPVNRQTTLGLPAADGALVALKKGGDFLPGVETVFRLGLRRRYESSLWQNPTGATYRAHFGEVEGGTPNIIN
jgi:hypothetical protein